MPATDDNLLGVYLRDRRTRLDPAAFGLPLARRRTPGLRREEVAQRANVSATWYTWLEQGRGGAPSADVLDRISQALMLAEVEREHLYLLALGRPPEVRYQASETVSAQLQRVLDAFPLSPAYVKTSTWDVLAWNSAAAAVLTDYSTIPAEQRNILRVIFCEPRFRSVQTHWDQVARFAVAAFRADVARAGAGKTVKALVDELSRLSPEFEAIWRANEVRSTYGEVAKTLRHPLAGPITLEYSAFAVEGRPDLDMVVYNPATPEDFGRVRSLLAALEKASI
ncbi:MAG: helix-turn-helix domain-containing protein [Alphaproteobacteria bacterium]|nr:helix-turn-helix domain-containing protein [Alphaproteobacteria bacterium]